MSLRVPDAQELADHLDRLDRNGYTIVEDAFSDDLADELRASIERLEVERDIRPGTNGFEGRATMRVYNLLALGELFWQVPLHPAVTPLMRHLLGDGYLVSSLSSITIGPGETAQPIHADDQVMPVTRPHAATTANSMWAITDFTEANGATRIIPGTHTSDTSPTYGHPYDSIPAEMPAGSVLVWHGSLWHGGGANNTGERRVGIAMNYCAGWIRQQENQQLGLPLDLVRTFPSRLQELCGFSVYNGLIGHIDRRSPADVLLAPGTDGADPMVWDHV